MRVVATVLSGAFVGLLAYASWIQFQNFNAFELLQVTRGQLILLAQGRTP